MSRDHNRPFPVGTYVKDTDKNVIGEVRGHEGPYDQLRPLGGGREWDARPEALVEVTEEEALRARVRAVNRVSRGELPAELQPARVARVRA